MDCIDYINCNESRKLLKVTVAKMSYISLIPRLTKDRLRTNNIYSKLYLRKEDSGQDGGISRNPLLPHIGRISITTNLKTKTKQNCQKIKLHGSPTTKKLKKKHSPRPVGGVEMAARGREGKLGYKGCSARWWTWWVRQQLVDGTFHMDQPRGTTGEQDRLCNPGLQIREIKLQNL